MAETTFVNTSYFIIPIWFDNLSKLKSVMNSKNGWERVEQKDLSTLYLLNYVNELTQNENRFVRYKYNLTGNERIYLYQNWGNDFKDNVSLKGIELSCFGSGVAFAEIEVNWGKLSVDRICKFIYQFKKVNNASRQINKHNLDYVDLKSFLNSVLPDNMEPFFYATSEIKEESLCYNMIRMENGNIDENALPDVMYRLGRGYDDGFETSGENSSYDLVYKPYKNDFWSGSQEGLANITRFTGEGNEWFNNTYKMPQLKTDYRFVYLLLLNQRFASLKYIELIAEASDKELKKLNTRIIELKTHYSFKVLSNDVLYQNLYTKMYKLLDLDQLLNDLDECEEHMALLYSKEAKSASDIGNVMLAALSVLTVFSTLIDSSSYFELFSPLAGFAKWISLGLVIVVIIVALVLYKRKNR